MQKKVYLILYLIVTGVPVVLAQNADGKHYSDYSRGFNGWAVAMFIEDLGNDVWGEEDEFIEYVSLKLADKLKPGSKLTKNNDWLMKKALNEWDYKPGEFYAVMCADSKYATEGILIFVVIKQKGDFAWVAFFVDENDLDDFDSFF